MSIPNLTTNDRLVEALLAAECPWNFVSIRQALDAVDAILCSRLDLERALHQPIHFYLRRKEATLAELATRTEQAIREIAPFLKANDHAAKVRAHPEGEQPGRLSCPCGGHQVEDQARPRDLSRLRRGVAP